MPKEPYYDATFFLQWLAGNKKVNIIPLGKHGEYFLPYFKNGKILTKSFLISFIRGKPKYVDYLPDNVKLEKLSKDFLYSVRKFINILAYCLCGA